MSIVTDTPGDWIKPLYILCPGDLNFEFHIEGWELNRCKLRLEGRQTEGKCAQCRVKMSGSRFTTGQWDPG